MINNYITLLLLLLLSKPAPSNGPQLLKLATIIVWRNTTIFTDLAHFANRSIRNVFNLKPSDYASSVS